METTLSHAPHLLMFVLPLVVFGGVFWLEWRRSDPRPARDRLSLAAVVMAVSTLGTAVVHTAVIDDHFGESALLGWFFLLLAVAQLAYVPLVLAAPVRRVVLAGVLANLTVVCLWAWTRTVGIPFGIAGGSPEGVGAVDLLATGFETGCVLSGLLLLHREPREAPRSCPEVAELTTDSGLVAAWPTHP